MEVLLRRSECEQAEKTFLVWEQSGTGYRDGFRQTRALRSAYDWILDVAPGARNRLQGLLRVRIWKGPGFAVQDAF